jgi:Type II secretion system (T2SS), protein E, N-terminal domain
VSVELGRRLLASGAVGQTEVQAALLRHLSNGTPFIRALLELGHISESGLEDELARSNLPVLKSVVPLPAIVDELPKDLCKALLAVPVRRDPRTGLVDVAAVDPYDVHIAEEFSHHLKSEVRLLRASLLAVDQALARIAKGEYSSTVILRKSSPPGRPPSVRPPSVRPGGSGPPIPLVRRAVKGAAVEVLGVRDIVEQMEGDGTFTDAQGEPIMHLRGAKVPRAPSLPSFAEADEKSSPANSAAPAKTSPSTARGPFSPRAPVAPFADIQGVLEAMDGASSKDEVIDCLIVGMSTVARRVGVFAAKKGGFRGVACNSELGDSVAFRDIEISGETPTVLGIAVKSGSYLGPMPETAPHEPLRRFMKDPSHEVSAVLVRVAGRPAVVLFADELGDSMIATRRAEELGREAGQAFSRIIDEAKARRGDA